MIWLTHHAVRRYHERVKPALFRSDAHTELEGLVAGVEVGDRAPAWVTSPKARARADAWAEVCDGVALALRKTEGGDYVATTCLARGGMGEAKRAQRNRERASRREAKRRRAQKRLQRNRRPVRDAA